MKDYLKSTSINDVIDRFWILFLKSALRNTTKRSEHMMTHQCHLMSSVKSVFMLPVYLKL